MNVDPKYFTGIPNSTGLELIKIMAKVPCKEDIIFKNSSFRKAISRYVRCYSQVSVFFSLFFFFLHAYILVNDVNVIFDLKAAVRCSILT